MSKKNEDYEREWGEGRDKRFYSSIVAALFIVISSFPLISIDTVEDVLYVTFLVLFFCVVVQLVLNDFFKVSKKINKILYLFYLVILLILIIGAIKIEETYILGSASIGFVAISLKICLEFKEEKEEV